MDLKTNATDLPSYMFDPSTFKEHVNQAWGAFGKQTIPLWDQFKTQLHQVGGIKGMIVDPNFYVPFVTISCFGLLFAFIWYASRGTYKMPKHRQKQIDLMFSDEITNAIEKLRYDDRITRSEKKRLYRRLSQFLSLPDLVPPPHPEKVKAGIKKRRANGSTKPVNIPGDPPPPIAPKAKPVVKRNRMSAMLAASKAAQPA